MTYQGTWWYPNYVEYGSGLNAPKTWPNVMDQYRRPHALYDLRQYDLPTEQYEAKLYYEQPRLGQPVYRGLFRDKPHTVPRHYPEADPRGKPVGFHGRVYYEDGPPTFKYEGPKQDKLYWLERPPYVPTFSRPTSQKHDKGGSETSRGLNETPGDAARAARDPALRFSTHVPTRTAPLDASASNLMTSQQQTPSGATKRMTQDGVGFL